MQGTEGIQMKHFLKFIVAVVLFISLKVSAELSGFMLDTGLIYTANSSEKSLLFISLPKNPDVLTNVYTFIYPEKNPVWENPESMLVYGSEYFNLKHQFKNPIEINANKEFVFAVKLTQRGLGCYISRSFIPEKNKVYGLIARYEDKDRPRKNILDSFIDTRSGKCFFAVVEIKKNHQLIPIKLQNNYPKLG